MRRRHTATRGHRPALAAGPGPHRQPEAPHTLPLMLSLLMVEVGLGGPVLLVGSRGALLLFTRTPSIGSVCGQGGGGGEGARDAQ